MLTFKLNLSPIAIDDLKNIVQYGETNWGKLKAHQYIEHLKEQFYFLTKNPKMGISRDEIFPEIRCLNVDSHIIYYNVQNNQIQIIRVLHGRQDPKIIFSYC